MQLPALNDLTPDLQKILDPSKPKILGMIAKGLGPVPLTTLIPALCFLTKFSDEAIANDAKATLTNYPANILLPLLQGDLPAWSLSILAVIFVKKDEFLEPILLNQATETEIFLEVAKECSEKLTSLIANNQERIIEIPDIILSLEQNPGNLKSNTDRLRHFLRLAGIPVSGDSPIEDGVAPTEGVEAEEEAQEEADSLAAHTRKMNRLVFQSGGMSEEQKNNLIKHIASLSIGGKVKLGQKGNKECRGILIKDTNKVVSLAVLKSPKLTDNEVAFYASLKSVADDVIRVISSSAVWTKNYNVKMSLCLHPKTPLQTSIAFIKFLNMRDLGKVARDRNIPGPLRKASKELLKVKRR